MIILREKKYLINYYAEATYLLENIAINILNYISSRNSEFAESLEETKDRETTGAKILNTINNFLIKLRARLSEWTKITLGQKNRNESGIINGNTWTLDMQSKNVFNIRDNVRNNRIQIGSQTDKTDKEKIEVMCDNYFYRLNELNNLMSPYLEADPTIDKVYPFKNSDNSTERNKILNWIRNIKRII